MKLTVPTLSRDLPASIVVLLVALPLCMGIAIASGVPAEKGLITGIIGGIVVGLVAGSPLQVSGPAAGLAVIVFEIVHTHGMAMLGPILILAGLLQFAAGLLKLGHWFRAMSPAVVHGMLAGIGVLIVVAQFQVLIGSQPLGDGLANLVAIPGAFVDVLTLESAEGAAALMVGGLTIAIMLAWEKFRPERLRLVPGALLGVAGGTVAATVLALPAKRVDVPESILQALALPATSDLVRLAEPGILVAVLTIAIIASAESLLSAAAVDRMHDGPRTNYDRELCAQGVGNTLCGLVGALPMTGVIVRSSANVQAGAATRWSAVLHGVWMLALVLTLPWLLREVPTASLAGVLVVTGWRLISLRHAQELYHRYGVLPATIWAATLVLVVATDLLTGVLVGLGLAAIELLPFIRRPYLVIRRTETTPGEVRLRLAGAATFLHLPRLSRELEQVPKEKTVRLDSGHLSSLDHTCAELIREWIKRRAPGTKVLLEKAATAPHEHRLAAAVTAAG
jgi:MFS superfamily sulfate permease-like transporter